MELIESSKGNQDKDDEIPNNQIDSNKIDGYMPIKDEIQNRLNDNNQLSESNDNDNIFGDN